jgi:hypothetical protein
LQGAGDEKGSLEMFGGEIWREKGHTLATWRENEGVERGILPASLWGDGLPQRVVGRRHGVGQRDDPVARSGDAEAVGSEAPGVFCKNATQPTGSSAGLYMPLGR